MSDTRRRKPRGIHYYTPPQNAAIPLRDDLTVHIRGLPRDMTYAEAAKISRVVMALADTLPHEAGHE